MQAEQQSERERFEEWIAKDGGDLSMFGNAPNRHYKNRAVMQAWDAWQARAALSHPSTGQWMLVPVEPTLAMLDALRANTTPNLEKRYRAMLDAAPPQEDKT